MIQLLPGTTLFKHVAIGEHLKWRPDGGNHDTVYVKHTSRTVRVLGANPNSAASTGWLGLDERVEIVS